MSRYLMFNNATGEVLNCDFLMFPGLYSNVCSKTSNYTITSKDAIIVCNNSTSMTITLTDATGTGQVISVKNSNNVGSVTINANVGGSTLDGELTQEVAPYECLVCVDGSSNNWSII